MTSESSNRNSKLLIIASIVCFAILILLFAKFFDAKKVHTWTEGINPWVVFGCLVVLPLVGFPVSVLFVVTGVKFGKGPGLAVVAVAIALHLVLSYWLGKSVLKGPIEKLFSKSKYKMPVVPEGEYVSISLLTALMPGIPYTVKNYLLVLGKVPFKPYFWCCLPSNWFHASLAVLFGGFSKEFTPLRIGLLVAYGVVLTVLCRHVVKRLKARKGAAQTALLSQE
jgi:uncharacterized membrane protein YdjX (TVP38/TMEM64 family)